MHLLIPFAAALSEAALHVQRDLQLPALSRLLARLTPSAVDDADEYTLSPPHERALAAAWGWQGADGAFPFAAHAAAADRIDVGGRPWGLLTPAHWEVGRDSVALADPAALELGEAESRALFDAVRPLFESEGYAMAWGAPTRWYGAHESLDGLPTASLDRVIGRNVELWVRNGPAEPAQVKLIRRLQSEVQLMLYPHPINEAREARGALTVNSFWLSGCGRAQAADPTVVTVDDRLRAPLLASDWAAWAEAWRSLDDGPLAALLAQAARGDDVVLTLCGERHAQRYARAARPWWQRLTQRKGEIAAALEAL
jgi:hypothetical protein